MLGKCFSIICTVSVIFALFNDNVQNITDAIIEGASKSVSLVISFVGIMALWNGILNVLKEAGIIRLFSKLLRPILKLVFPKAFNEDIATDEITACVSANILGISNAATPLALRAIEKLNEKEHSCVASNDMITLAMLGCCCFNLVPTTIIAIRSSMNATITYELIAPVWICSGVCCIIGVLLSRIMGKINAKN